MTAIPTLPITTEPPTGAPAPMPEGDAFTQIIAALDASVAPPHPTVGAKGLMPEEAKPVADPSAEAMAAAHQLLAVAAPKILGAGKPAPEMPEGAEDPEDGDMEAPPEDGSATAATPPAIPVPPGLPPIAAAAPALPRDVAAGEAPKGEAPFLAAGPSARQEPAPAVPAEARTPIREASQALRQHPGLAAMLRDAISLPGPAGKEPRAGEAALPSIATSDAPAGFTAPLAPTTPIAPGVQSSPPAGPAIEPAPLDPAADAGAMMIERQLDLAQDGAWLDQLAKDIARSAGEASPLRFRLNPENLGSLHVEITPDKGGAAIRLTADTEAARTIIADAQPRLVAEARAQGVRISEAYVDLSSQQQTADQRRQQEAFEEAPIRTARVLQDDEGSDGNPTQRGSDLYA